MGLFSWKHKPVGPLRRMEPEALARVCNSAGTKFVLTLAKFKDIREHPKLKGHYENRVAKNGDHKQVWVIDRGFVLPQSSSRLPFHEGDFIYVDLIECVDDTRDN